MSEEISSQTQFGMRFYLGTKSYLAIIALFLYS